MRLKDVVFDDLQRQLRRFRIQSAPTFHEPQALSWKVVDAADYPRDVKQSTNQTEETQETVLNRNADDFSSRSYHLLANWDHGLAALHDKLDLFEHWNPRVYLKRDYRDPDCSLLAAFVLPDSAETIFVSSWLILLWRKIRVWFSRGQR